MELIYRVQGNKFGQGQGVYPISTLQWVEEGYRSFKEWFSGSGGGDESSFVCMVSNGSPVTENRNRLVAGIREKYDEMVLNGFYHMNTKKRNGETRMLMFFILYGVENQPLSLCAVLREDNSIESLEISDGDTVHVDKVIAQLKEMCALY